jgi:O-methyltransferase domain
MHPDTVLPCCPAWPGHERARAGLPRGSSARRFAALMKKNPALRGVVFDRAHIVPSALPAAEDLGLHGRFSAVAGDFFTSVPLADLYLLKLVLHDWSDDACIAILKNCRRAIHPGGRIVAVEMLIGEIGAPGSSPLIDLDMLVMLGGRERNLEEYKALFTSAGFAFSRATPTSTPRVPSWEASG